MPLSRLLPLHLCSLQRATNGCAPFPAPRATIHPRTPVLAWSCTWCTCRAARDGGLSTCCLQQCCKAWHATKHGRNRMCRKCSMSTSLCAHPCMARARSPCARNLRPPWHPQAPYLCTAALAEPARKERQRAARRHKTAAAASGGCSSFGAEGVVCTPAESLGSHPTAALPRRGAQRHGSQLEPCRHAPSCRLLLATGSLARPCGCVRANGRGSARRARHRPDAGCMASLGSEGPARRLYPRDRARRSVSAPFSSTRATWGRAAHSAPPPRLLPQLEALPPPHDSSSGCPRREHPAAQRGGSPPSGHTTLVGGRHGRPSPPRAPLPSAQQRAMSGTAGPAGSAAHRRPSQRTLPPPGHVPSPALHARLTLLCRLFSHGGCRVRTAAGPCVTFAAATAAGRLQARQP